MLIRLAACFILRRMFLPEQGKHKNWKTKERTIMGHDDEGLKDATNNFSYESDLDGR